MSAWMDDLKRRKDSSQSIQGELQREYEQAQELRQRDSLIKEFLPIVGSLLEELGKAIFTESEFVQVQKTGTLVRWRLPGRLVKTSFQLDVEMETDVKSSVYFSVFMHGDSEKFCFRKNTYDCSKKGVEELVQVAANEFADKYL